MNSKLWHIFTPKEIAEKIGTDLKKGLTSTQILEKQKIFGENKFERKRTLSLIEKLLRQIKSPLVFILIIAGFIALFLREYLDSTVIFMAVFINTVIGLFQENKASNAFEKLRLSQQKYATVIRNGIKSIIKIEKLVPGDVVILEAGNYIPADIRLIETNNLLVNESILTGEWVNISKNTETILKEVALVKQNNMLWMGTLISSGYAKGVVVEIGSQTQLGDIAESLLTMEEEDTPVQKSIRHLARYLTILILVVIFAIFAIGLWRGEPLSEMLLISIALAVAIMPEGLPIAVTAVLAVGMKDILKQGGLVRNLLAAETLGSTTVILTDKTGTITEAKMKLTSLFTLQKPLGDTDFKSGDANELLKMVILSSDAFIEEEHKDQPTDQPEETSLIVRGRPLEKAMVVAGLGIGLSQEKLLEDFKRLDLLKFNSNNKYSASLNDNPDSKFNRILISGAPEILLARSSFVYQNGKKEKMTQEHIDLFNKILNTQSKKGMRVTALAYKNTSLKNFKEDSNEKDLNKGFVLVGLLGFEDPVREDVKEAIQTAKEAGTRVIMLTGDNALTATNIAEKVGIIEKGEKTLEGKDIEKMTDKELLHSLETVKVFARVLPNQKLRISRLLKKQGEIVAMTGDGVNDAPALENANIGISVGSGTEVAKESSDLILLNNSFSVIVYAIKEGRRIIDNLKKIVAYLLSTSFSEIFLIGGSLLFGAPLPILPAQILWANIVEEGLMNFAFVFEPAEKDVMKRRPVTSASNKILDPNLTKMILIIGIITGLLLGLLYFILLKLELPIKEVRTLMFVTLSLDSIFFTLSLKDFTKPIWKIDLLSNKYLIFSLMGSISLLLMAVFFLPLQTLLSLTTLNGMEMLFLLGVGIFNLFLIEITKYFLYPKLSVGHGPKFSNKQTPKSPNVRPKGFRVVRRGDLLKLNHQSKLI